MTRNDQKCTPVQQTLRPRQVRFLSILLSSSSIAEAARKMGISEKTARRWIKEDALFRAELECIKSSMFQTSVDSLQEAIETAVNVLKECMSNTEVAAICRIRAAEVVLKYALEAHSLQTVEDRIADLERRLSAKADERKTHVQYRDEPAFSTNGAYD